MIRLGVLLGASIRWLCRGCKTSFDDEVNSNIGWFKNIPILRGLENYLLGCVFILLVIYFVVAPLIV